MTAKDGGLDGEDDWFCIPIKVIVGTEYGYGRRDLT